MLFSDPAMANARSGASPDEKGTEVCHYFLSMVKNMIDQGRKVPGSHK